MRTPCERRRLYFYSSLPCLGIQTERIRVELHEKIIPKQPKSPQIN